MKRLITVALIAVIAAIALACGGGGCSNDCPPEQRTPTTDCQARPELCK